MTTTYAVTGAGPVGWTIASLLAEQGQRVRLLTRSGSGPEHPLIERRKADVSDPAQLADAFDGVSAVFHCIHGSAYTAKAWQAELPRAERTVLDAAAEAGAVVVFPESLYSYSEPDKPMREDSPREAGGGKRGVRTALLKARRAHQLSAEENDEFAHGVALTTRHIQSGRPENRAAAKKSLLVRGCGPISRGALTGCRHRPAERRKPTR